jgi:hypothetical protein
MVWNTIWRCNVTEICLDKRRQTDGYKHGARERGKTDNMIACLAHLKADEDTRLSGQETLPISRYLVRTAADRKSFSLACYPSS